ncbi:MAG: AAA family ATPase [Actinomycetales bacterium]
MPPVKSVHRIVAKNFRSLASVDVQLAPFTVLAGPNGSGKSNLLNVLRFLATTVRFDLDAALQQWGGLEHVQRQSARPGPVTLEIHGEITQYASAGAPDEYRLEFRRTPAGHLSRTEAFTFKRRQGRGRRIVVKGREAVISELGDDAAPVERSQHLATRQTTGLATLPKLSDEEGGAGIRDLTDFLTSIRILEPDVAAARQPSREYRAPLADDASNLADALHRLRTTDEDSWQSLLRDLRECLPGLADVDIIPVGGAGRYVYLQLRENGLAPIDLADASFGTVRLLALLTALHNPEPPPFLAIEEVDHGLHPYALDLLVARMRSASDRMQILAATHSPTLINRLEPSELVVCDRDPDTGASIIPAITSGAVEAAMRRTQRGAGELWFAGAIRGVPA